MSHYLFTYTTRCNSRFRFFPWLFLSLFTLSTHAQNEPEFDFYLPVLSTNGESLITQLTSALKAADLDNIRVKTTTQWHTYQQSIRHGRDGIYLSSPHFSAWLKNKHNFTPILKLSDTLSYVITVPTSDTDIFEIRDLVNKTICARPPLSLDYLLITQAFANNVQSAEAHNVDSAVDELNKTQPPCTAFSISEHEFSNLEATTPGKYIRLIQGPRYSNYAVFASPSINRDTLDKFQRFLKLDNTKAIINPLLSNIDPDSTFINITNEDYTEKEAEILSTYWGQ